jgi:hypothetical protein
LLRELERRGVAPAIARAAWERAVADGHIDASRLLRERIAQRRRRLRAGGAGGRRASMYNALLRDGFPEEMIEAELGREPAADGTHDDFP